MSFINRNANLILLLLILGSAVALVGLTVFFQRNFQDVNVRYNEKLEALKNISTTLETQQKLVNQAKQELDLLRARDVDFTQKFTTVKDIKESLEDEKGRLTREKTEISLKLATAETNIVSLKDEIKKFKGLYEKVTGDYEEAQTQNRALHSKIDELERQVKDLKRQLNPS